MTAIAHQPHPVTRAVIGVRSQLSGIAGTPAWSMDPEETVGTLADVQAAKAQLAELEARLLVHAERIELPGSVAMSSTANWLSQTSKTTRPAAHRTMRLAAGLDNHEQTRTALAAGQLHAEQAEVILKALDELPDDLAPAQLVKAESHLLGLAADYDAQALKRLGRRILEVIDPEAADAHEATLLEREERDAAAATRLTMFDDGHGEVHGRFTVDALTGAMLKKALLGLACRRHRAANGPLGERRPTPERLGQAFIELIQRYPVKKLPKAGGLNATVVVTMTLDTLEGRLQAASIDTGQRLSPGAARRLACQARLIPAVLGTGSKVLDLGRATRFATEAQRIAKLVETGGCEADGCDQPPAATDLHHETRWVDGGRTNLAELIALCDWHHHRAHDTRYQMARTRSGTVAFHRRT